MKKASVLWLVLIQWVLAFQWLHSSSGKWLEPGFMANIGKTLTSFSTGNPNAGYANFLNSVAIPNAELFGNLIRTSELLVGLALACGGLWLLTKNRVPQAVTWILVFAFLGGILMNLNFFLAGGWSSPSSAGINLVMGLSQLILGLYYLTNHRELVSSE